MRGLKKDHREEKGDGQRRRSPGGQTGHEHVARRCRPQGQADGAEITEVRLKRRVTRGLWVRRKLE